MKEHEKEHYEYFDNERYFFLYVSFFFVRNVFASRLQNRMPCSEGKEGVKEDGKDGREGGREDGNKGRREGGREGREAGSTGTSAGGKEVGKGGREGSA